MNTYSKTKSSRESVQTIVTKRHEIPYALIAWTDGACNPNPGPGGWGFRIEELGGFCIAEGYGGEPETTNNRMELLAIIEAIKATDKNRPLIVCTDSQLTMLCAIGRWKRKTNSDLWRELELACEGRFVVFEWWRGHCGTEGNERADWLANQGMVEGLETEDVDTDVLSMLRQIASP